MTAFYLLSNVSGLFHAIPFQGFSNLFASIPFLHYSLPFRFVSAPIFSLPVYATALLIQTVQCHRISNLRFSFSKLLISGQCPSFLIPFSSALFYSVSAQFSSLLCHRISHLFCAIPFQRNTILRSSIHFHSLFNGYIFPLKSSFSTVVPLADTI